MILLKIAAFVLVIALFLYTKLRAVENQLDQKYQGPFKIISSIMSPVLGFFRGLIKPVQIGYGLSIDLSPFILLIILLLIVIQ